jgi:hypothetical protein
MAPDKIVARPGRMQEALKGTEWEKKSPLEEDLRTDWPPLEDNPPSQQKPEPTAEEIEKLPDAWKPGQRPEKKALTADNLGNWLGDDDVPVCETTDPGQLEAWYGPYGFFEHYRKIVLANCREIVRATAALQGQKITVDRTDDLGRLHANYLSFLTEHLKGRQLREQMARERMGI